MFAEVAVSASSTDTTIQVWDIRTGSTLFSFKQSMTSKGGLALVPRPNATLQTGALLAAQNDRAVIHMYNWDRDHITLKMVMQEKMVCMTASHQGTWAAGATEQGRVFLWHIATGHLVRVLEAHYRRVTRMVFSDDDAILLTAGEDATINVWLVAQLVAQDKPDTRLAPLYCWSDHTLPVTDAVIASGTISSARVYTSSQDRTVRQWDMATGHLLTTFLFPKPVLAITVDPSETMLFAAGDDTIYIVELYRRRQHKAHGDLESVEHVGGMGRVEAVATSLETTLTGHQGLITSLALSFDGTLLVSSSEDGKCIVWDVASRQHLRSYEGHKGPVTHVACLIRPEELEQGATRHQARPMPWKAFKRTIVTPEDDQRTGIDALLTDTTKDLYCHQQWVEAGPLNALHGHALDAVRDTRQMLQHLKNEDSQTSLQSQVGALQSELTRLHDHHVKVKALHDDMYQTMVTQFMADRRKRALHDDEGKPLDNSS